MEEREWFTVTEVANHLQVSKQTIWNLIKSKKMEAYKINSRNYRINAKEVVRFHKDRLTDEKVRLTPPKPLLKIIYSNWAFTENGAEKGKINEEIYHSLMDRIKVAWTSKAIGKGFDLVLTVEYVPGARKYTVHENNAHLTAEEIALIVDGGNLCFGFSGNKIEGKCWLE